MRLKQLRLKQFRPKQFRLKHLRLKYLGIPVLLMIAGALLFVPPEHASHAQEVAAPTTVAQAETGPAAPRMVLPVADPLTDPKAEILLAVQLAQGAHWIGLLVVVLLLAVKAMSTLLAPAHPWFASDQGKATVALATSTLVTLSGTLAAGQKFAPSLLLGALAAALTSGAFNLGKKLAPSDSAQ